MSDELRAWLESAKLSLDVGYRALWAVQYGPKLIAKIEELAGAIGECDEILDNMDVDFEASAYIAEVRTTLRAALRAPGGGEG